MWSLASKAPPNSESCRQVALCTIVPWIIATFNCQASEIRGKDFVEFVDYYIKLSK